MSNKYYLILLNFTRYLFSVNIIFLLMRNVRNETLNTKNTKVKVFHESISCFMKWLSNYISWNSLKEKLHSVSLPLDKYFDFYMWSLFYHIFYKEDDWSVSSFVFLCKRTCAHLELKETKNITHFLLLK